MIEIEFEIIRDDRLDGIGVRDDDHCALAMRRAKRKLPGLWR